VPATDTTSPRARRPRRHVRAGMFVLALLAGAACSPSDYTRYTIGQVFGSQGGNATRIAECESNLDPNAVSPTNDHGLFQLNAVHAADFERVTGQPWVTHRYNTYWNTYYAKWLHDRQGWTPWACRYVL
jgi:hypothetical protein